MKISEVIKKLEEFKEKHGDLTCCTAESHDYWGSIENRMVVDYSLHIKENAQPKGPKSSEMEKCVIFGPY